MYKIKVTDLFSSKHSLSWQYLKDCEFPWEIIPHIERIIIEIGKTLSPDLYDSPSENVWIAKTAKVFPSAYIKGPAIIGENTEVRHCAFIRGSALIGNNCVVGNSSELKNCILFDNVQVPHFNYVGDSVIGFMSHMGAGSITSNFKSDHSKVSVQNGETKIQTGLQKMGAIIGDYVEIGCNTVLNPGTIICRNTTVYPLSSVRGVVPGNSIYKSKNEIVVKLP